MTGYDDSKAKVFRIPGIPNRKPEQPARFVSEWNGVWVLYLNSPEEPGACVVATTPEEAERFVAKKIAFDDADATAGARSRADMTEQEVRDLRAYVEECRELTEMAKRGETSNDEG